MNTYRARILKIGVYKQGDSFVTRFGTHGVVTSVDEKGNLHIRWDGTKKPAINTKTDIDKAVKSGSIEYIGFNPHFGGL